MMHSYLANLGRSALWCGLFLCTGFGLLAQGPPAGGRPPQGPAITGRISGLVVDSLSGQPIEFATVVLTDTRSNQQVDGVITDATGAFKLTNVKNGQYRLQFSFLGYAEKTLTAANTTLEKPDLDLGTVALLPAGINLDQVTVTGQAAVVENRIDKLVYNADKDISNTGGDAADVLRRVPLLSVDLDGNVSLRGSSNILVLINGRPSTIFAGSIADALKTIPADQIKSVEVITSPSAKYDGEGSAGIINIITKRKNAEGLTGSVNTSVGTRQNNGTFNLNLVRGRFGLNTSANTFWSWRREGEFSFLRQDNQPSNPSLLQQAGTNASQVLGYNGSLGAFYDINAYHALNANVRLNGFNNRRDGIITGSLQELLSSMSADNFSRDNDNRSLRGGFDATLDYRRTFPNSERELSVALQLSGAQSTADNTAIQNGDIPRFDQDLLNTNDGLNLEYIGQVDYVHPFGPAIKLETGLKGIFRRITSDYETSAEDLANPGNFVPIALLTDGFWYNQDVYATYLSFNLKLSKQWGLVAGARYEHTEIDGDFDSDLPAFTQTYDNILPSFILSRSFKNFQTLKLSYNRRIQRPSLFYINPFTEISDPNNISFGNPGLFPELVDQVELGYNTFVKGISLNGALYYRQTSDLIESYLRVNPSTLLSETSFLNIGQDRSVGFNGFASITLREKLTLRGGFNIFTYNAQSTIDTINLSRNTVIWNGNFSANLKLPRDWQAEGFAFFRSPRQTLQGINPSFWLMSFGVRKDFSKRMSLGFRVIDPFFRRKRFPSELQGDTFYQRSEFSIPFQSYGLSFQYSFGKLDFNQPRRRRGARIDNNDLKDGGDSNF